jgi:hypothetical protein
MGDENAPKDTLSGKLKTTIIKYLQNQSMEISETKEPQERRVLENFIKCH